MSPNRNRSHSPRWLPNEELALQRWLTVIEDEIQARGIGKIHPVIQRFQRLIDEDPVVRMYVTQMVEQIPAGLPPLPGQPLKDVNELLQRLNAVLTVAPPYVPPGHGEMTTCVGCPISAILIYTMGTPAGFAAYRHPRINAMFKEILAVWTEFLDSEDSRYVLNEGPNGWQSPEAVAQLEMGDYDYDPNAPYWGFSSWNDFFTREVKPTARPVTAPDDSKLVVAGCDSTVYRVVRGIKNPQREFWVKTEPYSLADMLDNQYVDEFIGGDVWQAYLSPFNYHRWHSPVAGTVRKAYVKEGLYFSQADCMGEDPSGVLSEAYIVQVQTRALIFIDADDPVIGLVCMMPVGMVEISSCVIDSAIQPGERVTKGQELGYFQYGGSTHCVVFRQGAIREFTAVEDDVVRFGQQIAIAED
jgi:phosphatidylserine decarboxylase